jgi:hypothetical protein
MLSQSKHRLVRLVFDPLSLMRASDGQSIIKDMNEKPLIWVGMFLGSTLGGLIPLLWGADLFSFSSIIFGTVGALFGIWISFKLS